MSLFSPPSSGGGAPLADTAAVSLAAAGAAGVSSAASRADHVHPWPSPADIGAVPVAAGEPWVADAAPWGAVPDAFYADGVTTSGSTTFTSASAAFTSADVGKNIVILRGGVSSAQDHHTAISAVTNATTVTLSHAAGRSQGSCRFYISRGGDQTAAIQACIDACSAAGGGTVLLRGAGYLTTGLVLRHRVMLEGAGRRATMLHLAYQANAPVIRNDNTLDNTSLYCGVRRMWVDGNRARQADVTSTLSGSYAVNGTSLALADASGFSYSGSVLIGTNRLHYTSKSGNTLNGVEGGREATTDAAASSGATVTQHRCHGISLSTAPYNTVGANAEAGDAYFTVNEVYVKNVKGDGISQWGNGEARYIDVVAEYADHFSFRTSFDTFMSDCTSASSGRAGFYSRSSDTRMSNCKAFFAGGNVGAEGWGFFLDGVRSSSALTEGTTTLSGCFAQDNKADGFYLLNATRVVLTGVASTNGTSNASGGFVGVRMDGARQCAVTLASTDRGSTASQKQAVSIATGARTSVDNQVVVSHGPAGSGTVLEAVKSGSTLDGNRVTVNGMGSTMAVAYAATVTPDPYQATTWVVGTLTGAVTIANPATGHRGAELLLVLTQDATGGRTVTWGSAFKVPAGAASTTASAVSTVRFVSDGTNWLCTGSTVI